jgi:hypothetical protein
VLLTKLEYLARRKGKGVAVTPDATTTTTVLRYGMQHWKRLQLPPRVLAAKDLVRATRHGAHTLFHLRAFPRRAPETFVIVVTTAGKLAGHILIDLDAESGPVQLDSPSQDFRGPATIDDLKLYLPCLQPGGRDAFAIVGRTDGTYLQTLCTTVGWQLEYQLVNASSHYATTRPVSERAMVGAMVSYAAGKTGWLERFVWKRLAI